MLFRSIEVVEVAEEVAMLIEVECEFAIDAEVVGEDVTFSADPMMSEVYSWVGEEGMEEVEADVTLGEIDSAPLNVVDETIEANLRWNQNIEAFGEEVSVQFSVGVTAGVDVTADGVVTFQAEGELVPEGVNIQLNRPGLTATFMGDASVVTFGGP